MNCGFAPAITVATAVVAALGAAVMVSTNAYADDITIDPSPLVSTRSRAEVKADLMSQRSFAQRWAP